VRVAYPDGRPEAKWSFEKAAIRNGNNTSKNERFYAIAASFEPGGDWLCCYVREVLV
jgi:hypothetical protein